MNPDKPSRDEIEVKLTALLLGELPADEAKLLRWTISQDAALQKLHDELASTIILVREAEKNPAAAPGEKIAPLKLSGARREKLLAHFKTPRKATPLFWLKRIEVPRLATVLACVALVGLVAAMFLPALSSAKKKRMHVTVIGGKSSQALATSPPPPHLESRTWSGDNAYRYPAVASIPSASPTAVSDYASVAAAPLASQIILPPTESPQPVDPVTGLPTTANNLSKFSTDSFAVLSPARKLVDGSDFPVNRTISGVANATDDGQLATQDRRQIAGVNNSASLPGARFGGSGGGGAGGVPSSGSAELAWFDSGAKRSRTENPSLGLDEKSRRVAAQEKVPGLAVNGAVAKDDVAVNHASDSLVPPPTLDRDPPRKINSEMARPDISKEALDSLKQTLVDAQQKDFESAGKLQPYYNEKNKLVQMEEVHQMLGEKISAMKADLATPTTSMVQVTEAAQPNQLQSFWQGLKGEYASTARVKIEGDGGIVGFSTPSAQNYGYDPYFIPTTMEIIKSQLVLGKVVDELKLDTLWANENGGQKLSKSQAVERLKSQLDLKPIKNTKQLEITVTSTKPEEAAKLANAVAEAYKSYRVGNNQQLAVAGLKSLQQHYLEEEKQIREIRSKVESLEPKAAVDQIDKPLPKLPVNAPIPQPEILTRENNFSTFSLNVSDVSFKLAAASLERGQMPDAASIRSEEFINAFDYRDPEAKWDSASGLSTPAGVSPVSQPLAFASERARYPFAPNRELLRFSVKAAAAGRPAGRALNLVLLLDNSGSMERADRVAIIREALRVLATQLQPQDTVSVVTFARTARLWADGLPGDKAGETLAQVGGITPEGGTNLEEAMRLAYETARRHYLANGMNRVVLLTDGAANLGDVNPADLKQKVEAQRKQGIALDCFGIGFEDFNDDLLEQLSSNGDGRYAFLNSPEAASKEFAAKLAGALRIAASDVKVQVEFNPQRVISYRQIGYAKHQLTKEQFRDNTVDAAEIAAQEAGNALYTIETKADGIGPIATVRVRYRVPNTQDFRERSWNVEYTVNAVSLEQSSAAMRLAATASAFSEWLAASPFAPKVTPDELLKTLSGVPQIYGADERPKKLEWMIRQVKSILGK